MFELTERVLVAASIDDVWADFTRAAHVAAWFWPPRLETVAVVDPVVRGCFQVRSEIADLAVAAEITEIEAPYRLRLAWRWVGEDHVTDAEITLESADDATTRVIVRHTGLLTHDERGKHVEGWSHCLARLVDRYALRQQ